LYRGTRRPGDQPRWLTSATSTSASVHGSDRVDRVKTKDVQVERGSENLAANRSRTAVTRVEQLGDAYGVLSVFGPGRALSRRVNLCCVLPTSDGDTKRIHRDLSWFGQKKALRPARKGEYCISLHLSACVGGTSCEREPGPSLKERVQWSVA
jgi:hypothetical protein